MTTLLDKIAALRQQLAEQDTSIQSELLDVPTPLWVFTILAYKAEHESYLNYMEGAKALEEWLTTPATPLYPTYLEPRAGLSRLGTYTTGQLADIASRYSTNVSKGLDAALQARAVCHTNILHYIITQAGYTYEPD
jgi:hypothetical protein